MAAKQLKESFRPVFKANPIPASSIVPKYKELMVNQSTKSADLRNTYTANKRIEEPETKPKKLTSAKIPQLTITAIEDGQRKREMILENEERAGLTKVLIN